MTFKFPNKLPKEWIEVIERNGRVGSEIHGLKVVGKDKRGTIVHPGKDSFKILHNGKNQNVFGNPLIGGLDPNFGYETAGGATVTIENVIRGSVFTCPKAGKAVSISAFIIGSSDYYGNAKAAIYKHSDLSLVGSTGELYVGEQTGTWFNFTFSTQPDLINTEYVLVVWAQSLTGTCYLKHDAGDTDRGHYQSATYGTFPNPLVPTHDNNKYSIYCSYTAAAAKKYFGDGLVWIVQ
jgi:hypothetical protein